MKALVYSAIVQGSSTPPLLLFIMLMTTSRAVMGDTLNSAGLNLLGWRTVAAIFSTSAALVISWLL